MYLFGSGLMGFDKPDAVGGDAIDPQDADVESGGMTVEADFNLVIIVLVQGEPLDGSPLQVEDLQLGGTAASRKRVADMGNGREGVGNVIK